MPQLQAYLPCIPREKLSKIVAMSKVQVKADSLDTLGKGNKYWSSVVNILKYKLHKVDDNNSLH